MRNPCPVEPPLGFSIAGCRSFIPSAASLWNSLPVHISSDTSLNCFTRSLDSHFTADRFLFGLSPLDFFLLFFVYLRRASRLAVGY